MLMRALFVAMWFCLIIALMVIVECISLLRRFGQYKMLYENLNETYKTKAEVCSTLYQRERSVNEMILAIVNDLLNSTNKATLRWKFHVLRRVRNMLMHVTDRTVGLYDALDMVLKDGVEGVSRPAVYRDIERLTQDYYMLDLQDGEPLLKYLQNAINASIRIEVAERDRDEAIKEFEQLVKRIHEDFVILDTDPLGELPHTDDARAITEAGCQTREEMLERLIALANEEKGVTKTSDMPSDIDMETLVETQESTSSFVPAAREPVGVSIEEKE